MATTPSYAFPEELLRVPRDASAVVEASAGTGKTFLLEHLVADRIIRGDARLEEILVVTFTEKATAELVRRLRALIARLLSQTEPAPAETPPERVWTLDAPARARLLDAQHAFDRATITTIHGFCQRVLTEDAFASRRLLAQEHVDSKRAFGEAFKDVLRTTLATDATLAPYLAAWLTTGKGLEKLEKTLYEGQAQQRPWGVTYDETRLRDALTTFVSASDGPALLDLRLRYGTRTGNTMGSRVEALRALATSFGDHGSPARFLLELDELFDGYQKRDLFGYIEKNLPSPVRPGATPPLLDAFLAVADAAVPLELAIAQLFLPPVRRQLAARKAAAGRYDFDDMLRLVAEALRRPDGATLAEALRRRYRLAIIDEFQDTDGTQWEIFRRIFHDSDGRNPLIVIGDPKQAIYGFRGADVMTYGDARRAIAGGDVATLSLDRNFRSTPAVIAATNAIFDDLADEPFFSDRALFRDAVADRADSAADDDVPPVTLLAVGPAEGAVISRLPLRHVRQTLTRAIADEIEALRATEPRPALREMFVLTRSNAESQQVAATLRDRGIAHVLYNQEGLYKADEARHVRDLLTAIDDPRDRARRLRVALTPFFGLALEDLPALAADPTSHPMEEQLAAWRALADARDWAGLFDRVVAESGVVERELLSGGSARRLMNYLHLFEVLRDRATREPLSVGELARHLTALVEALISPEPQEGNVQRLEGDRDAVQIMTIHKSKGLEADHVFLYGAFSRWGGSGVRAYERDGQRWLYAGRARRAALIEDLDTEAARDDQRLLYVALTRARRRLYLPYAGDPKVEEKAPRDEDYWRINGAYRHVHRRLRALHGAGGGTTGRFATREIICPPPPDPTPARIAAAVRRWRPAAADLALDFPAAALAEKRRRHAGIIMTSYTRIKQAHGGYQPPTEVLDEQPAAAPAAPPDPHRLPGGALSGIFLHAVLEKVPLASLADGPTLEAWAARPEIRAVFDVNLRRHDRDPAHRADAERLVHAALTTPLDLPSGRSLSGVAHAARVAREVEFLFPFPAAAGGADAGFVKGYVDFIFEHEGRTYFGDWKSDLLPDLAPGAVSAHVAANYELQRRLYALALVKMLGITDEADYDARFGGTVYVFLRALPGGLEIGRPSWSELNGWERQLVVELGAAGGPP
jgi:exodeoxyribonuclease V beta subunit